MTDDIVVMNRSTNCSRRPIFKAADEFLHHCTCFDRLKERQTASVEVLNIFHRDMCEIKSICDMLLVKYIALLQPVQALAHFVCKYSIFFYCNAKLSVFQLLFLTATTNLAVNKLTRSREGAFF